MPIIVDFETTSNADLRHCGAYAYAAHPSTRVVCMAWMEVAAADSGQPQVWTPDQPFPAAVAEAARRPGGLVAHNAMFECVVWNRVLRRMVPGLPETTPETWEDSMARAAYFGLPLSLEKAGRAAGLSEQKDAKAGRKVIKALHQQHKGGWLFGEAALPDGLAEYVAQDVRAEAALFATTRPLPDRERAIYLLDARINARGVGLDVASAKAAKEIVLAEIAAAKRRLEALTGGAVGSPTEIAAFQKWLASRGVHLPDLQANTVEEALRRGVEDEAAAEALSIRAEAAGSAVAKLDRMLAYAEADGRMRGLLQYYGAPATGRWAGRGVQPQNLPRPEIDNVDPEDFVRFQSNPGALSVLYDGAAPLALVKSALRRLLWADPGKVLLRADFSAIEARIVFWLAGQQNALDLYRLNADIYCKMASRVFKRPITKADTKERFVGKCLVLGCGYGLGAKKFLQTMRDFGHDDMTEQEARDAVRTYRETWISVPRAWAELERAAAMAYFRRGARVEALGGKVSFRVANNTMLVGLPSGRTLHWRDVRWDMDEEGLVCSRAVAGQGARGSTQRLYGGAILERISQATARDIMADAMLAAEANGMPVVLTVHDEIVCEVFENRASEHRKALLQIMSEAPRWAAGLPLAAEAEAERRYGK